jgi:hypothetical protein
MPAIGHLNKIRILNMKFFLTSAFSSLIIIFLLSGNTFKEKQYFRVGVTQNGKEEPIVEHKITIAKDAFSLLLKFEEAKDVVVNASFEPISFDEAAKGTALEEIKGFHQSWLAESNLNPDRELQISDSAPSHWFFDNEEEHRFNTVKPGKNILLCERIIENFYLTKPGEIGTVKVKNAKKNKLYLVFISKGISPATGLSVETHREFLEITFK